MRLIKLLQTSGKTIILPYGQGLGHGPGDFFNAPFLGGVSIYNRRGDVSLLERYRILDHEADIGFEVYGDGEEELFQNAALALFSLITDLETVLPVTERHITITGNGEALILFLNELLYVWDVDKFLPRAITIKREQGVINATLRGETFDAARHSVLTQVKAVTYHQFSMTEDQGRLKAVFIVDM